MADKLVSICIPTYKQTFFLKKCLDSVFAQTYSNYEVIITDDTPDDTIKIFLNEHYSTKNIHYFKNSKALGSPANWNFAISKAKGDYVKILHHDDYFSFNDSLAKFVKVLDENVNCDFAFSLSSINNADSGMNWQNYITELMCEKVKLNPTYLICANFIGSPSATIYKKNSVFFDENLKWVVDLDFYISILLKNKNFTFINEPLITTTNQAQHQVTNSCINNPEVELYEFCYLIDKYRDSISFDEEIKKVFLNLFYNYKITTIEQLLVYFKNANKQIKFYDSVFEMQTSYNMKRNIKSKIKFILEKFTKK